MATHNYSLASDFVDGFSLSQFNQEIKTLSLSVTYNYVVVDGDTVALNLSAAPSGADITAMDTIVSGHGLALAKASKIRAIDKRSVELIEAGFTYASKKFSLSLPSQAKMMGVRQVKDDPALTYPIKWNTVDDSDTYDIPDAATLESFYLTGLGTVRSHLDSGTSLKDSVRAATTVAEVDAVVDTR